MTSMLDYALKNILRQKTRTSLTVIGILIGIGAIVALGSISEGINNTIEEEFQVMGGIITVVSKGSSGMITGFQGSELTRDDIENLKDVSGVKDVAPFTMRIGKIVPGVGPTEMIIGFKPEDLEYFKEMGVNLDSGRELEEGDTFQVMVGYGYAEDNDLIVGDIVEIQNHNFEVVGIIEKLNTQDDYAVMMPLDTMMDVYDLDTYRAALIIPEDVSKVEDLAESIESDFEDFEAQTSAEMAKQLSRVVDILRFFTIGIGSISAIVGGLGVMNTMIMSVLERRREIGIMKAIGATRKLILTQILIESVMISLVGGIIGILFGFVGSYSLRSLSRGLAYARVTPELIVGSILFAIFLGIVGGLYPAWIASKLDPIEALRYE